jgi:hypothetical protein
MNDYRDRGVRNCDNESIVNGNTKEILFTVNFSLVSTEYSGARCWWRSCLRHCATIRKVAGSTPDGVIEIFH